MASPRRAEIDALRGAALLGICLVNVPFLAGIDPLVPPEAPLDRLAAFAVALLFQGKFFVLFSFLFGWGFGSQQRSARGGERAGGRVFGAAYAGRLAALATIGIAHALLVFVGDILVLYALLGTALWAARDATVRRLSAAAAALVVVAFVVLAALGIVLEEAAVAPVLEPGYLGSFADAFRQRLAEWPLAFGFVLSFNGPIALAAFCAGLAAARRDLFAPDSRDYAALRRRWPVLLVAGLALNLAYAGATFGLLGDGILALLGFAALALGGPCLAGVYLIGVVELVRRGRAAVSLAVVGRLSLSAYVAEGALAGLLFNGYGLGLHGRLGDAACVGVAVLVYALVHALCGLWWRSFGRGPLERLLGWTTRASERLARPA